MCEAYHKQVPLRGSWVRWAVPQVMVTVSPRATLDFLHGKKSSFLGQLNKLGMAGDLLESTSSVYKTWEADLKPSATHLAVYHEELSLSR